MRSCRSGIVAVAVLITPVCFGEEWELGGAVGFGYAKKREVSNRTTSGDTGFKYGFAAAAVAGHDLYNHLGGEFRYTYRQSSLIVSSAGREAKMSGDSHAAHYDLLFYTRGKQSRMRPFFAAGGGVKVYRGTGPENALQPLATLAILTKTKEVKPLLSVGAGVRAKLWQHAVLRAEFRDYITPFPFEVIAPAPGARLRGWIHDFVPMVGISAVF